MTVEPVSSTIIGAGGELYAIGQLLRRGMIAALAPAGVPHADIIASSSLGSSLAALQAKAQRNGEGERKHRDTVMRSLIFDDSHQGIPHHGPGWLDPDRDAWASIAAAPEKI